jgi:hypothetical protein
MARKRKIDSEPVGSAGGAMVQPRRSSAGAIRPKHFTVPSETLSPSEFQAKTVKQPEPSREEIARLAYAYWESRGRQGGSSEEDWLRAERELRSSMTASVI